MCTTFIAKLVLSIINTLVFLVGLIMFIIGLLIHTQPEFSQEALSSLLEKLESATEKAGVELDTSDFSVADIAYSFIIPIIVIGLFLAGVSVLGLIGVKYSLKPVLLVYFIITMLLFLAQVTVVLVAVIDRDVFDDNVKPRLKDTIEDYFTGLEGEDAATQIWNGIQIQLECCGVDSYEDYADASEWTKTINNVSLDLLTPVSCCKNISRDFSCAEDGTVTDDNNNWKTGCYNEIWNFLMSNSGIVTGIAVGILCSQFVILLLTCVLLNSTGKVSDIV